MTLDQIARLDTIDFGAIVKGGPEADPFRDIKVDVRGHLHREYLGRDDGPIRADVVRKINFNESDSYWADEDLYDDGDDFNAHFE